MRGTSDGIGCTQLVFVYQNRAEQEADFFVWKHRDTLHFEDGSWRFLRLKVELDQNVILVKYLKIFF
jgi:hypothetical protein